MIKTRERLQYIPGEWVALKCSPNRELVYLSHTNVTSIQADKTEKTQTIALTFFKSKTNYIT